MKNLILLLLPIPIIGMGQIITNSTTISITKYWSQEPNGYTYPIDISVPSGSVPQGGFPVCILLHGNGGQGAGMLMQYQNVLDCHVLVAPSGYMNSWNICGENSDAPDVEMVTELILNLQSYININPSQIRILGSSNGSALANRVFIENSNTGVDMICGVVSQLNEEQYHNGNFYYPSGATVSSNSYCGYNTISNPISGRKYLSVCNTNDPVIPYSGGASVGVNFLNAEFSAYIIAQNQGYTGSQITGSGTPIGSSGAVVYEYSYLSDQVVLIKGNAAHGINTTQRDYIGDYFEVDCSATSLQEHTHELTLSPNPTQNIVKLKTGTYNGPFKVMIYDLQGSLLGTKNEPSISLKEFPNGVYFFKVIFGDKTEYLRVIKQ